MGRSNNNNNNNYTKTTGAKIHSRYGTEKGVFITAWNKGNKVKVFRSEKQQEIAPTTSKNGIQWCSVTVVLSRRFERDVVVNAMLNINNHSVHIDSWNMIIKPTASNGGYFGQKVKKGVNS